MDHNENHLPALQLKPAIECLLFVSTEPVSVKELAAALQMEQDEAAVELTVEELRQDFALNSGLQIIRLAGGYQMCTRQDYAEYVARLLQPGKHKLSRAALETLAVVAYRQPVTQPEIEAVRGVKVDGVMKTLLEHLLIKEVGRKQSVGRPILYATTREFLQRFGLNDIGDLPDVDGFASQPEDPAQQSLFEPTGDASAEAPSAMVAEESASALASEGMSNATPVSETENVTPSPLTGEGRGEGDTSLAETT